MNDPREQWTHWLADFRQRFIQAHKWTEKEARLRLRDGWACRDGRVHVLVSDAPRPADVERLTGLVVKAMTSQRSPRDIALGLLSYVERSDDPDESDEIKQKRNAAAFWAHQLLDACEDKALAGVVGGDVFWQALLYALEAGNRLAVLGLHSDSQVFADLVKAQAFQSGRGPDELSRCLEASFIERQAALGRDPTPQEVFEAAGGVESKIDECWEFNDINGAPSVKVEALYRRLDRIRQRHS